MDRYWIQQPASDFSIMLDKINGLQKWFAVQKVRSDPFYFFVQIFKDLDLVDAFCGGAAVSSYNRQNPSQISPEVSWVDG